MKFIDGGDLSFEELERIMFLGGLKKRRKKMMMVQETQEKSRSRSRSLTPEKTGLPSDTPVSVSTEMSFMIKTSMKLQYAVMCTQVPIEANELELFKFFSFNGGKTRDVAILYNGERPSGTAFVEFLEFNSLRKACSHTNPEIFGKSMILRPALDVRNEQQAALAQGGDSKHAVDNTMNRRLRITNLLAVINESDMLGIFKPFGDIEAIDMHRKDGRKICEITFKKEEDARDAVLSMQGFELAGQPLKLRLGDGMECAGGVPLTPAAASIPPPPPGAPSVFSAPHTVMSGVPPPPHGAPNESPFQGDAQLVDINHDSDFGATRREGSAAQARMDLMRKLAMRDVEQGRITNPNSRTLRLQNMFDPSNVDLKKEPHFFAEIEEDVVEECKKFGGSARVHVNKKNGIIHLMFKDFIGRQKAEGVLSNRWFGGRRIVCEVVDDSSWQFLG
eukprot:GEMP01032826.1.p1 GENE.GEMP01032826.1~~GEMP01032826.1.p1  ORF type:complete len:447 (+),score=112.42 GEMP01032826.1:193-1533(+)